MASATVKAAVQTRLQDWPGRAGCPFYDGNDAAPALFRETGAIRFVVHILNMSGLDDAMALVETLRDFFREQKFGGVETFEASPPALDKSNRARAFYLLPFVVTYKFDQIR
jgi:hypothetical protein